MSQKPLIGEPPFGRRGPTRGKYGACGVVALAAIAPSPPSPPLPPLQMDMMGSFDNRMIARIRLILASQASLIIDIYIAPAEPARFVAITCPALVHYTFYIVEPH